MSMSLRITARLFLFVLLLAPAGARAQAPAQIPAAPGDQAIAPLPQRAGDVDPREEMRRLVQSISAYARNQKQNFAVIASGGVDLLVKRDPLDMDKALPANTYRRSLSGVMQTGVYYGVPEFNGQTDAERRDALVPLLESAHRSGLPVLIMDYAKSADVINQGRSLAAKHGFVFFGAPARGQMLNRLPGYPSHPFGENPDNILSLGDVHNFVALRNTAPFGRQDEFALKMHGTNFDLVAVNVFHRPGEPLTKQAVETLKYKKIGGKRLVFAFMNIGTAASYDYFWKANWREGAPLWISAATPEDPDRYFVEYWQPEWQQIVTGNENSYLYGIIQQGFDGVILEGLDSFRFFTDGLDAYKAGPGSDY